MKKQSIALNARTRTHLKKKVQRLRDEKRIPAVLYGKGLDSSILEVDAIPFNKVYVAAGETTLVDLSIDGDPATKVIIHDVQREPIHNAVIHVDFYRVRMDEKLAVSIPLVFIGESKAVKELGGILVRPLNEIEVRCLPSDLVHEIAVDIGVLATFDDTITTRALALPSGIELVGHTDEVIALVVAPVSEDQSKIEGKPVEDVSSVEVEKKGKKEEEKEP